MYVIDKLVPLIEMLVNLGFWLLQPLKDNFMGFSIKTVLKKF